MTIQVNHPTHYNTSVAPNSRPALEALGFTTNELDSVECIAAMEDTFGPVEHAQELEGVGDFAPDERRINAVLRMMR